ncbi:D-alanyl-D-alanine carboxypeptidase/D-alanyl-D-alanine endopeptidase [Bacillus marinisedimentorum]|uniref:D-alanyl-D-alanine carboxypeptidase/D-alanyl-D-alanine endopeptidase n=1 Tax=Bacillus marinisedimentorum TaxID=1821260 RepID=UPI0007DE92E3|nr:D-alanyl-D-alanine carboxypeptidase/D-alanyl-D-alanine-endopeptidase [Bacillus marinisedimentorum]
MTSNRALKKGFLITLIGMLALFACYSPGKLGFAAEYEETDTLHKKIGAILDDPLLDGAIAGVCVRKADDGELLYSHFGDIRLHPASNMKLLTGAAALDLLGPDYRFSTEVLTDGKMKGDVLEGNVYLKGKGDPTLLKEDMDRFANDLKEKGIRTIKGDLVGDDSWYDDERLSQDLNWSDESNYTGAQVSALTLSPNDDFDAGSVIVTIRPGEKRGGKPEVELTPETDYVTIINNARTAGKKERKRISIEREHGTNNIVIEGTIPLGGKQSTSWVAVWEPTGYALSVFKQALEKQGIRLRGDSEMQSGITPEDAAVLAKKQSMRLTDLMVPFMKLSNNGHGETLVKEIGKAAKKEGSWEQGLAAMKENLQTYGVNTGTVSLRDGSGMSHKNMIPANELSRLLFSIQDKSWFPAFEKSLPAAGEHDRLSGGTLRNRMALVPLKGNLKAKTGSLTGVSALSGYVTNKDGEKLIFSILINNYIGRSVDEVEDAIVAELAGM